MHDASQCSQKQCTISVNNSNCTDLNMMIRSLLPIACLLVTGSQAFSPNSLSSRTSFQTASFLPATRGNDEEQPQPTRPDQQSLSRRNMLGSLATSTTAALAFTFLVPMDAAFALPIDDAAPIWIKEAKVLVLGGTGFVGSRVVQTLRDLNIPVTSTSRDGRDGTTALDFSTEQDVQQQVQKLAAGCTAVISCVGTIGTDLDEVVNSATALAAAGAKAAGVQRFVYITVAPEVKEFAKDIDFLKGYMKGKTVSRDAVLANFPGAASTLIEPTFIYGGGSFELSPPRVAGFYGKIIEGLLSSGPIRAVTGIAPAGIIKIALEPPVPVEAVASAAVAGALGRGGALMVLDTYDEIKQAASLI
jgi:hypothetical protein